MLATYVIGTKPSRLACLSILVFLLLSACSGLDERLQARIDANEGRIPQSFDSPETAGLLIIDVDLRHQGSLSFGLNQSIGVDEAVIRRSNTRETMRERPKKKLVFFQVLPGAYELVTVRGGSSTAGPGSMEPFLVPEAGPIEVAAGQIVYVGKLTATAHSKLGQFGLTYTYSWDRDRAREAEALAVFEQHYGETPWIPVVRTRLASLP